jgi:RNA 3'-terminal phosphate cyclase
MYNATVSSFGEGTTELIFCPGVRSNVSNFEVSLTITIKHYIFPFYQLIVQCDSGTASSITLMMQALLPCLLFGNITTTIDFKGGTNGIIDLR